MKYYRGSVGLEKIFLTNENVQAKDRPDIFKEKA